MTMKLYRVDWHEDEPASLQTDWASSKREAAKIARDGFNARVTEIEVPTDRAGLLAFLKEHIWCDAGIAIAKAGDR